MVRIWVSLDIAANRGNMSVVFHRPIEKLEIIVNGEIVAVGVGNTQRTEISLPFQIPIRESAWIAARAMRSIRRSTSFNRDVLAVLP